MPKFVISKFFSIIIFLAMMIFFFFWITNQITDLGLFFGFRTSHTVANDLANLITSLGSIPGEASANYPIAPATTAATPFNYKILIADKIVCATSFLTEEAKSTTDCASHTYDLEDKLCETDAGGKLSINIKKKIVGEKTEIEIEGAGCKTVA